MEHIYTIKVKRKADPRGLYPSERRYSASTVLGLAWLHLALAGTCLLLTALALYTPPRLTSEYDFQVPTESTSEATLPPEVENATEASGFEEVLNVTETPEHVKTSDSGIIVPLVIAPCVCAAGALGAGFAALLASKKWYMDHNITWFFLSSLISAMLALSGLVVIMYWIVSISETGLSFCDYFSDANLFGKVKMVPRSNSSWTYVIKVPVEELQSQKIPLPGEQSSDRYRTRKVLSINILIAVFIELIWSILSIRVSWNGMRNNYPDNDNAETRPRTTGTVRVVTEIKGNNAKHLPKNTKILPPQPDLIEHHPKSNKVKKFFKMHQESGDYFIRPGEGDRGVMVLEPKEKGLIPTESDTEYRDRMMGFLNNCASRNNEEDSESPKPSIYPAESWGDLRDHTIYDQNTLDLDKIMKEIIKKKERAPAPNAETTTTTVKAEVTPEASEDEKKKDES